MNASPMGEWMNDRSLSHDDEDDVTQQSTEVNVIEKRDKRSMRACVRVCALKQLNNGF